MTMFGESGYERQEDDFYRTPAWCTKALLDTLPWNLKSRYGNGIWEPVLTGMVRSATSSRIMVILFTPDINPRAERIEKRDFLTDTQPPWYTSMLILYRRINMPRLLFIWPWRWPDSDPGTPRTEGLAQDGGHAAEK